MGLANLGSESETCVGRRVRLVGVSISFEKNFYRLPFTPPSLVRRIGPSMASFVTPRIVKVSISHSCGWSSWDIGVGWSGKLADRPL
jgi:hypothetical protein